MIWTSQPSLYRDTCHLRNSGCQKIRKSSDSGSRLAYYKEPQTFAQFCGFSHWNRIPAIVVALLLQGPVILTAVSHLWCLTSVEPRRRAGHWIWWYEKLSENVFSFKKSRVILLPTSMFMVFVTMFSSGFSSRICFDKCNH